LILPAVGGQTREDDKWIMGTPELVVEIASSSASYDLHEKREDYERYRVREYLVYAVRQRRVYWWIRRGNEYHELAPGADDVFRSETFPGLWLDAAAIIQSDGSKINETLRLGLASQEHTAFAAKLEAARKTP
jgi:Uma2 family endonuclease